MLSSIQPKIVVKLITYTKEERVWFNKTNFFLSMYERHYENFVNKDVLCMPDGSHIRVGKLGCFYRR